MSVRKISSYNNSNEYIQKSIELDRIIPRIGSLEELEEYKDEFNRYEYLSIYQQIMELEIWNNSSESIRKILAPIVRAYYDNNNALVLVFPRYQPLVDEKSAFRLEDEEALSVLQQLLAEKGMSDYEIGEFIEQIYDLCDEWDLCVADIMNNLNNIGWHSTFKVSIIDYGLGNEMIDVLYPNI